jgi:hypothetical protein
MTTITTPSSLALVSILETAWQDVDSSFERFCLTAGIGAIEQMLCDDAQQLDVDENAEGPPAWVTNPWEIASWREAIAWRRALLQAVREVPEAGASGVHGRAE